MEEYREMADEAGKVWMKHGALEYFECVGDDLDPDMEDMGDVTLLTFPDLVKTRPGETVVFAFIVFESREHRDEVNEKVMAEMKESMGEETEMPFDVERMAYGGFRSIVDR